jgi:4a-hydroxytetrahydrobiopterin dehydratase
MQSLSDIEIQRALGALPGWSRKGDVLTRTYQFATFPDGIDFLRLVADVAEAQAHHPDVDVRYTRLTFNLSTHDAGGITEKDFTLARAVDALYQG